MAYNYFPMYQNPYQMIPQQQVQQPVIQQQQVPQMQNGGFMSVTSEQEARNYPVAPGNVITFKIEGQPYVCEKSQGFSQLEGPKFEKYRLVKEEQVDDLIPTVEAKQENNTNELWEELNLLKEEVKEIKSKVFAKPKTRRVIKEVEEDECE